MPLKTGFFPSFLSQVLKRLKNAGNTESHCRYGQGKAEKSITMPTEMAGNIHGLQGPYSYRTDGGYTMSQNLEQVLGLIKGELGFLDTLSTEQMTRLTDMFDQARENQRAQTNQAIEAGLQIIPGFLRKAVRKVLGDS